MPAWTSGVEYALKRQTAIGPPILTPEQIAYNNAPEILAITGTFFTAAMIVVLLRFYVRLVMLKLFGIDDYVMVFAMVRLPTHAFQYLYLAWKLTICSFWLLRHLLAST